MPKTDINTILKDGAKTKINTVDYSTPENQKHLKELKKKSEEVIKNKWPNWARLSRLFIKH